VPDQQHTHQHPRPASDPLQVLTLAISGFHRRGAGAIKQVLLDWFEFIGGRPAEVVYVDGGSPAGTTRRLAGLVDEGLIDRLELLNPRHWENSFDRCYIQEYRSGMLATRPYVLFIKPDMLPFRRGHDDWIREDLRQLDQPHVFAITNTHLIQPPSSRTGPYLVSDFTSLNFALMKRPSFHDAMRGQIGAFIDTGFQGDYPAHIRTETRYRRALIEWAWLQHCQAHNLQTLGRAESPDWTIFHINKNGRKLLAIRRAYRSRRGLEPFFNLPKGLYRPPHSGVQRAARSLEAAVRAVRDRFSKPARGS
jgi:hypothetical protein